MGWFPKDVTKRNFAATTQPAEEVLYRYKLSHHMNSSYPYLNCVLCNYNYATDIMFASEPSFTRETCAWLYASMESSYIFIESMHTDS